MQPLAKHEVGDLAHIDSGTIMFSAAPVRDFFAAQKFIIGSADKKHRGSVGIIVARHRVPDENHEDWLSSSLIVIDGTMFWIRDNHVMLIDNLSSAG